MLMLYSNDLNIQKENIISGYRIVEKFTADYPMALQTCDLLRYDLFGKCVRGDSNIPIINNCL